MALNATAMNIKTRQELTEIQKNPSMSLCQGLDNAPLMGVVSAVGASRPLGSSRLGCRLLKWEHPGSLQLGGQATIGPKTWFVGQHIGLALRQPMVCWSARSGGIAPWAATTDQHFTSATNLRGSSGERKS